MTKTVARPVVSADLLRAVGERLTDRDRRIIRLLHEHRILTTDQVCEVAFTSQRRAEARLRELYALRVVDRVRPARWPGSSQLHWILDVAGAEVIAEAHGVELRQLGWDHRRAIRYAAAGLDRDHLVGVNGFFTGLIRTARATGAGELAEWWSERRCLDRWGEIVQPDGFGVWREDGLRLPFLLEYDRGTERPASRVAAKLAGYERLAHLTTGSPWCLLFCFPTTSREARVRQAFRATVVTIATAALGPGQSAAEAVWWPLNTAPQRVRLAQVGAMGRATSR